MIHQELKNEKVLFAFSDPGGAKAILSFAFFLQQEGRNNFTVVSDRQYDFFPYFNLPIKIISSDEIEIIFSENNYSLLFTGTSTQISSKFELKCILSAKKNNVPSWSFIEHWTALKERFRLNNEYVFPEKIFVPDERAIEIALQEGLPEQLLKISNNPYFRFLKNWKPTLSKNVFLKKHGIDDSSSKIISFLPEPLSNVGGIDKFGIDEYACLEILIKGISQLKTPGIFILIKPHPNQNKEKLNKKTLDLSIQKNNVNFIEEDINTLMYFSDIIVGIFSNALIEATVFRKPIVRILEGLKITDPLEKMGIGTCVFSEGELINTIKYNL